jgi:hypothetical protein
VPKCSDPWSASNYIEPQMVALLNFYFAPQSAHATLPSGMTILTAAKRMTTSTPSMSIISTSTKSTITASGAWGS